MNKQKQIQKSAGKLLANGNKLKKEAEQMQREAGSMLSGATNKINKINKKKDK